MFGKNASSSSSANVEVNVTLDYKNTTFSGVTTFNSPVINNSTLTQLGDASFNNLNIDSTLTYNNFSSNNLVGNLTGNVTGKVTGNVTGTLIPITNGSISGDVIGDYYTILYDVKSTNINRFPSHYFQCNENLAFAIFENSVNAFKPLYCSADIF